jgi:CRISPR-associated exonuclease Cas4
MEVDDLLPLSGLQHLIYCERQFALIHVEQIWSENELTISGSQFHERADLPGLTQRASVREARAMLLHSNRLQLAGKADVVEFHREQAPDGCVLWRPFPVEYKRGRPKVGGADEVQLCAQAICLEEMFSLDVLQGALFYGTTRRRKAVAFTQVLRDRVAEAARRCHELFEARETPRVARNKRCDRCSLLDVCLPATTGNLSWSAVDPAALARSIPSWDELSP